MLCSTLCKQSQMVICRAAIVMNRLKRCSWLRNLARSWESNLEPELGASGLIGRIPVADRAPRIQHINQSDRRKQNYFCHVSGALCRLPADWEDGENVTLSGGEPQVYPLPGCEVPEPFKAVAVDCKSPVLPLQCKLLVSQPGNAFEPLVYSLDRLSLCEPKAIQASTPATCKISK